MSDVDDLLVRVSRLEAQVARINEQLGIEAPGPPAGIPLDVIDLAASGNRLAAIKRYRELTGADLDEAKRVVGQI